MSLPFLRIKLIRVVKATPMALMDTEMAKAEETVGEVEGRPGKY